MTSSHHAVLPTAPVKGAEPTGPQPVFHHGDERMRRLSDPTVAVAITINVDIRNGERAMSASTTLHELPLMRRLYDALGGTVTPRADWVAGTRRRSKLSHLQLQDELVRMSQKYILPAEGGSIDVMGQVYGTTGADRLLSLRNKMVEAQKLWAELETRAMTEIRAQGLQYHPLEVEALIGDRITEKDIDRILRALDPAMVAADAIELEDIETSDVLLPATGDTPAAAAQPAGAKLSIQEVFGQEEDAAATAANERIPVEPSDNLSIDTAELSDVDLLVADLRKDGLDEQLANTAAVVVTSYGVGERGEKLREHGFKGKALAAVVKRGREYDAATK